jgi:catechol 2,3-dioxygenase
MAVTTNAIFGEGANEPALPGTYGQPPRGFRLPNDTRLGPVRLRIADLARSTDFYESVLGMRVLERDDARASLGAQGDDQVLVELREQAGTRPAARRGRLGLYHFAILLPGRPALGRFAGHLGDIGVKAGAADHLVSEAFYLQDPDDLGIEIYADKARNTWRRVGRELMIATDPLDTEALLRAAGDERWNGMPAGTAIGHIHLHVGDIEAAAAFFCDALGFDRMTWSYPGALFLGAGGYHHHVGTNTWAGPGAQPRPEEAGLLEWIIELPDAAAVNAAAANVSAAGYTATRDRDDVLTADPWGTVVRLQCTI